MKYSELKRLLKDNGCYHSGEFKGHERWYSPITGKDIPIGRHGKEEVKIGTLNAILKQAGIKKK